MKYRRPSAPLLLSLTLGLCLGCSSADDSTATHAESASTLTHTTPPASIPTGDIPDGLSADDWDAIQQNIAKERYAFQRVEGLSAIALNPAQRLRGDFANGRLEVVPAPSSANEVSSPGWKLGIALSALGRDQKLQTIHAAAPLEEIVEDKKLEFRRPGITEWYLNDERGIEQGFDIHERPEGDGELVVVVAFDTELSPRLADDTTVIFRSESGQHVLRYSGIVAWDSQGKDLNARMELAENTVRLVVDDAQALYPVTVDPWIASGKVLAEDGGPISNFGNAVAVDGDVLVVGDDGNQESGYLSGAAYVFTRSGGGPDAWSQATKLVPDDVAEYDQFGFSVAVSGDTVLVGAIRHAPDGIQTGSAFVFYRDEGGPNAWGQVRKIVPNDYSRLFGHAVALDQDVALVGAMGDNERGSSAGAAYLIGRDQGGTDAWEQIEKWTAPDAEQFDTFGHSVAIDGDWAVVGTPGDSENGLGSGSAYVYRRNEGVADSWEFFTKLLPEDGREDDEFGASVSIAGDVVVVAAPNSDTATLDYRVGYGSAYVFHRDEGGDEAWGQAQKILPQFPGIFQHFARSIAVAGDVILVGHPGATSNGDNMGAAHIYARDEGGADAWGQVDTFRAEDREGDDLFGEAVALDGDTLVMSSPGDDDNGENSGSLYLFDFYTNPVANDDTATVDENDSVDIDVLANDTGDTLSLAEVSRPQFGNAVMNGTLITYTPDADFYGEARFYYTVSDAWGVNAFGDVVVTVTSTNTAPIAQEATVQTDENRPFTFAVAATDVDGDDLTFTVASGPQSGLVTLEGDQAQYTPNVGFHGTDTFTFEVSDGEASDRATITIEVIRADDDDEHGEDNGESDGDATSGTATSGCGCTSTGGTPSNALLLLAILGVMGLQRRRR